MTGQQGPGRPIFPILLEIAAERSLQETVWGEQNHPNGTGPDTRLLGNLPVYGRLRDQCKTRTDTNTAAGTVTFADILLEEVFEALAEADPAKLRTELVQVAAVAAQWVEAIDRADAYDQPQEAQG